MKAGNYLVGHAREQKVEGLGEQGTFAYGQDALAFWIRSHVLLLVTRARVRVFTRSQVILSGTQPALFGSFTSSLDASFSSEK